MITARELRERWTAELLEAARESVIGAYNSASLNSSFAPGDPEGWDAEKQQVLELISDFEQLLQQSGGTD